MPALRSWGRRITGSRPVWASKTLCKSKQHWNVYRELGEASPSHSGLISCLPQWSGACVARMQRAKTWTSLFPVLCSESITAVPINQDVCQTRALTRTVFPLTDDLTFPASTLSCTGVQYTISRTRLRRKALQLTNSKKYKPPHNVHSDTTSSQMKASKDSSYKRKPTDLSDSENPWHSKLHAGCAWWHGPINPDLWEGDAGGSKVQDCETTPPKKN